jgi:hypothetical protein
MTEDDGDGVKFALNTRAVRKSRQRERESERESVLD